MISPELSVIYSSGIAKTLSPYPRNPDPNPIIHCRKNSDPENHRAEKGRDVYSSWEGPLPVFALFLGRRSRKALVIDDSERETDGVLW